MTIRPCQLCRQRQLHLPGQRRQGRHRHRHGHHHGHPGRHQRGAGKQCAGRAECRPGLSTGLLRGQGNRILLRDDAGGNDIELTLTATNGTVTLAGTTGLSITGGADGSATVTVQGSLTDLNNALDGLIFAPTAGYFGSASLQVATNDLGQSGAASPRATPTPSALPSMRLTIFL